MQQLSKGLRIQGRVIGALMMRELHTRYGRDNIGFIWVIVEPLMFAIGVETLWSLFNRQEHGLPLVPFILTGYLPLVLWRHGNNRALTSVAANRGLLFHRQVKILDLLIARYTLEVAGVLLAFIVAYVLFWSVGLMKPPKYIWSIYCGWLLMIWFVGSTGLVLGALAELSDVVERIYQPMSYLMVPLSGCFWAAQWIPEKYRSLALLVPTVDAIELIRGGYFGEGLHTYTNVPYVCWFCSIEMLMGLLLVSYIRRRVKFE
jgi:capsular polysaccharide transport system permease protein